MPLPSPTTYGTVTGKFLQAPGGSNSAPVTGSVLFTPSITQLVSAGSTPPTIFELLPVTVSLDASGAFSQSLVATDNTSLAPVGWVWNMTTQFTNAPNTSANFFLPGSSTRDMASIVTIPSSLGAPSLGTIGPAGIFSGSETLIALGNVSGTVSINLSLGSAFSMTLTGATTITFTNVPTGSKVVYATLRVTRGASGLNTLTITSAVGSYGSRINLSTAIGAIDKMACESWDGGTTWDSILTAANIT